MATHVKDYTLSITQLLTYCDILDHATNGLANIKELVDTLDGVADAISTDTATTIPSTITTLQAAVDAIKAITDMMPDAGALNDLATILADTANMQPKLGTPASNIAADIAAIKTLVDAVTAAGPTNSQMETARDAIIAALPAASGTDDAFLASVGGALDDIAAEGAVTEADTAMQYLKQLVTLLIAQDIVVDNLHDTDVPAIKTILDTPANFKADVSAITAAGPTNTQMNTAHALLATPAQVASAISTYDPPTKGEMDTGHGLLATPAQVATALTTYDAPTKGEMDTAHALLATPAQVATALGTYDAPTRTEATSDKDAVIAAIPAMVGTNSAALASVLGALADAAAEGAVTTTDTAIQYIKQLVTAAIANATAVGNIPTTAMRGTDSVPTTPTLQATWTDAMATALANYSAARAGYLDELAAANLPTDVSNVKTVVDAIPTTAMVGTDDAALASVLGAAVGATISADIAAVKSVADTIPTTAMRGTDSAATEAKQDTMQTAIDALPTTNEALSSDWKGNFTWDTSEYTTNEQDISALFSTNLALTTRRKYTTRLYLAEVEADASFDELYLAVKEEVKADTPGAEDRKTITKAQIAATAEPVVTIVVPATGDKVQITMQMKTALAGDVTIYYSVVKEHLE